LIKDPAPRAEAVAEGLRDAGCEVDLFNTNEGRYDMTRLPQYDCVAIDSPDYYSYIVGRLKMFMDDHYIYDVRKGLKGLKDRPYVLFYSHGGGGRVKDNMRIFCVWVHLLVSQWAQRVGQIHRSWTSARLWARN